MIYQRITWWDVKGSAVMSENTLYQEVLYKVGAATVFTGD